MVVLAVGHNCMGASLAELVATEEEKKIGNSMEKKEWKQYITIASANK